MVSMKRDAYLTPAERKELARRRTLARIRSLREQANRLERILNGEKVYS